MWMLTKCTVFNVSYKSNIVGGLETLANHRNGAGSGWTSGSSKLTTVSGKAVVLTFILHLGNWMASIPDHLL